MASLIYLWQSREAPSALLERLSRNVANHPACEIWISPFEKERLGNIFRSHPRFHKNPS